MHLSRCQCPCSPLRTNSFQSVHQRKLPEHPEIRRGTDCNEAVEYIQQRLYLSGEWSPSVYRSAGAACPSVPTCLLSVTAPSTLLLTEPCPALPLPNGRSSQWRRLQTNLTMHELWRSVRLSDVLVRLLHHFIELRVCLLRFNASELFFIR